VRAVNHALTGALIGLVVGEPLLAAPMAFVSHFVCDAIPHFGIHGTADIKAPWFKPVLLIDALLCLAVVVVLAVASPVSWLLAAICAFLAASPDLFSAPRMTRYLRSGSSEPNLKNPFLKFHHVIQHERPYGIFIELAWLASMLYLLEPFIR
jgi:hypothetical protein